MNNLHPYPIKPFPELRTAVLSTKPIISHNVGTNKYYPYVQLVLLRLPVEADENEVLDKIRIREKEILDLFEGGTVFITYRAETWQAWQEEEYMMYNIRMTAIAVYSGGSVKTLINQNNIEELDPV